MTDHASDDDVTRVDVPPTDPTMATPATAGGPPAGGAPPAAGPPQRSGDPRWWILAVVLAAIVAAGLAFLLLRDDDDDIAATTTTTTSVEDTTTSSSTTTTDTTTTSTTESTTTTTPPTTVDPARCTSGGPDDPDSSVQVAYEAYTLGDRECAAQLGTEDAIGALFDIPGGGGGWTYQGCSEQELPDPHIHCAYTFPGGATHFRLRYSEVDEWVVFEVYQTAD